MKKIIWGLLSLVLLGLAISGCSSKNADNTKNDKIVTFYLSGDKSEGNAYSKMAKKYEKETGIKVKITDVPYSDLTTKIDKAVQAKDEPDIARVSRVGSTWRNSLQNLTSISKKAKTNSSLTVIDEKTKEVTAIPSDITSNALFINKTLFEKAGVKYPTSDQDIWTWDKFIKAVKKVQSKTDARYGLVVDPSDQRLRTITYQFGGHDFQLNKAGTAYKTDAATVKALKSFVSWNNNKLIPKTVWTSGEDPSAMFKSGQVAAYFSGSWQIKDFNSNIKNFDWSTTYMPYQKHRDDNLGGNYLVAFKNGNNPKGGKAFLKWLYQPKNYKQLCEYAGYLPAIKNVSINYGKNETDYKIVQNEIDNASDMAGYQSQQNTKATMDGHKGLSSAYKDAITNVINDQGTIKEAIKKIEKDYKDGLLGE